MLLYHYSMRGPQNETGKTRFLLSDLRYRFLFPYRAETLFCNSTFDWSYANEASLMRNSLGAPLGSKVYYQCDTNIIFRDT